MWFFTLIFQRFVLEAQKELDNELGYLGYLLVLKRSFLGLVTISDSSWSLQSYLEVVRIQQNTQITNNRENATKSVHLSQVS